MRRILLAAATCVALVLVRPVAANSVHTLSMHEAIDQAIHHNVNMLLSRAKQQEVASGQGQARAALLPQLSADIGQSRQKVNLAAQGFPTSFPGVDPVVTFNMFQARVQLRQSLINVSDWQRYASARAASRAAADKTRATREQIAARAAIDYVSTLRARQAVKSAQADVSLARHLAQLAKDKHDAGLASGVDVTRAQTALAQRKVALAQAQTQADRAAILLARVTGLPLGTQIALTSSLKLAPATVPPTQAAIRTALHNRPEIQLASSRLDAAQHRLSAAHSERLPTLSLTGAYGRTGNTPVMHREETYRIGAQVNIPIFSGGAIHSAEDKATSQLRQARLQQRDTHDQVEQDVRLSLRTLKTSTQRLQAARDNRDLAKRELKQSRDRFAAGVGDNIEVVHAQTALANAHSGLAAALAQYASARVNLATALGNAQSIDF